MTKACKFCGEQIQMIKNDQGKWLPNNPDGSPHRCRDKNGPAKPQNTNEHQEFENQKAVFSPAMENEIRRIVKEDLAKFLQWLASQSENQP